MKDKESAIGYSFPDVIRGIGWQVVCGLRTVALGTPGIHEPVVFNANFGRRRNNGKPHLSKDQIFFSKTENKVIQLGVWMTLKNVFIN